MYAGRFMHALKPVLRDQGSSNVVHPVRATCTRRGYSKRVYVYLARTHVFYAQEVSEEC